MIAPGKNDRSPPKSASIPRLNGPSFEKETLVQVSPLPDKLVIMLAERRKSFRKDLTDETLVEKVMLVDEHFRPEFVAKLVSHQELKKRYRPYLRRFLDSLSPLWTRSEKQRFLKTVADRLKVREKQSDRVLAFKMQSDIGRACI